MTDKQHFAAEVKRLEGHFITSLQDLLNENGRSPSDELTLDLIDNLRGQIRYTNKVILASWNELNDRIKKLEANNDT